MPIRRPERAEKPVVGIRAEASDETARRQQRAQEMLDIIGGAATRENPGDEMVRMARDSYYANLAREGSQQPPKLTDYMGALTRRNQRAQEMMQILTGQGPAQAQPVTAQANPVNLPDYPLPRTPKRELPTPTAQAPQAAQEREIPYISPQDALRFLGAPSWETGQTVPGPQVWNREADETGPAGWRNKFAGVPDMPAVPQYNWQPESDPAYRTKMAILGMTQQQQNAFAQLESSRNANKPNRQRFIESMLAGRYASGQGVDLGELNDLIQTYDTLSGGQQEGLSATTAPAPGRAAGAIPPRLTVTDVPKFASLLGAAELGTGKPSDAETMNRFIDAITGSTTARQSLSKIFDEAYRVGYGGGEAGITKPLLNSLVHRAQEVYNPWGTQGLNIPGSGLTFTKTPDFFFPNWVIADQEGEIGRVPVDMYRQRDTVPTREGSETHRKYKSQLELGILPAVQEYARRKRVGVEKRK